MKFKIDQMSGRQQLFAIVFLLVVIMLTFTVWSTDSIKTLIVSFAICVVMYFSRPIWLPENYGRTRVRIISLTIALTAILSYGFWQQFIQSAIISFVEELFPQYSHLFTAFQLPPPFALGFLLLVIIAVNFFNRDHTAMGVHPNSFEDDIPDRTYQESLESVTDALIEDLKTIDRRTKWNSRHFTPLEAEVETVKNNKRQKKFDDLLTAIRNSNDRVFLVIGEPGSGKSVALRKLCQDMLGEVKDTRKLPIYVNLKEWTPDPLDSWQKGDLPTVEDLETFIRENVCSRDITISRFFNYELQDGTIHFERLYDTGHLYFVLDSFDEIPAVLSESEDSELIKHLSTVIYKFLKGANPNRSQGILSSRIFRQPTSHFDASIRLEIRPFSEERIQHAFKNYGLNDEKVIQSLFATRPYLIPVATNPFSATLLAEYYLSNGGHFPENQSNMYESYMLDTLSDCKSEIAKRSLTDEKVIRASIEIANKMFEKYGLEAPLDQLRNDLPTLQVENVVGVLRFGKIGRLGIGNENLFSFAHRRFAEYFEVGKMLSEESLVDLNSIPNDSQLRDALVLYCEVAEEEQAQEIADFCWQILEETDNLQNMRAIHSLRFLSDSFRGRLELLSHFRDSLGEFIIAQINSKNDYISIKVAVEATGILKTPDIDESVLRAFKLNVAPINEASLKSCRNLPSISRTLERSVMDFIDTYQGFSFLKQRKNLQFSLKLSQAFHRVKTFVDLKVWNLWMFLFVWGVYIILFPGIVLLVYMLSAVFILGYNFISVLTPLPLKRLPANTDILSDLNRLMACLTVGGVALLTVFEAPVSAWLMSLLDVTLLSIHRLTVSSEQIYPIYLITSSLFVIVALPIHMLYRYSTNEEASLTHFLAQIFDHIKTSSWPKVIFVGGVQTIISLPLILVDKYFPFIEWVLELFEPIMTIGTGLMVLGVSIYALWTIWSSVNYWWRDRRIMNSVNWGLCSNRKYVYEKYIEFHSEYYRLQFVNLLDVNIKSVSGNWPSGDEFEVGKVAQSESRLHLAMLDEKWRGYNR